MKKYIYFILVFMIMLSSCSSDNSTEDIVNNVPNGMGNIPGNIYNMGFVVQDDLYVYFYSVENSEVYLAKAELNGQNSKNLYKGHATNLNIYDGWIYFVDTKDYHLYKIDTNGNNISEVIPEAVSRVYIWEDVIYYMKRSDWNVYSYNIVDSTHTAIINKRILDYCVYNGMLLYLEVDENGNSILTKHKINEHNNDISYKLEHSASNIQPYKENVIYNSSVGIHLFDTNQKMEKQLVSSISLYDASVIVNEKMDYLYYCDAEKGFCRINLETGKEAKISNGKKTFVHIANNKIFWYEDDKLMVLDDKTRKQQMFGTQ